MRFSRVLLLLFAVFSGLYLVPRLLVTGPAERAEYAADVTARMDAIKTAIDGMLAQTDGACVHGDTYLVPNDAAVTGPFTGAEADYLPRTCDRCDDLAAAGLVAKTVTETQTEVRSARGETRIETRFTPSFVLTPRGREVYTEELRPSQDGTRQVARWKFCFGKTRLHHIDEALPAMMLGANTYIGVKYTSEVVDPHPFLFDPRAKPLRLTVPSRTTPALNEPKVTTVVFYPGSTEGVIEDSFRYGKFINE